MRRQKIAALIDVLEDRIEDLVIATSPEVRAALEQLIAEAISNHEGYACATIGPHGSVD
jgi:hypothetical protein